MKLIWPRVFIAPSTRIRSVSMEILERAVDAFETDLSTETNIKLFLAKFRNITRRFVLLEEDNTLNGSFSTVLGLAEQYNHELLIGASADDVRSSKLSATARIPDAGLRR
jgi:hypothetical protein